jgi:tetratricopeptide (TPR) repeat protein
MDDRRETSPAHAVVVPFGVPTDGRGLGLGLAALVHGLTRLRGENVGLAQIVGRRNDEPEAAPAPVEAFILPQQWRDLAGQGNAPGDVRMVLTGAFEPPDEAPGALKLMVFDARNGSAESIVEAHVDPERAGAAIVDAVEKVWTRVGGEVGELSALRELSWGALESVLRAERCALHDPTRGGPHDRLAAMMHLGRAVEDAPDARYPAGRLAAIALDAALGPGRDPRLAEAAVRAVTRAVADAPGQPDLLEATAALHVRLGHSIEGEATALAGLARDPSRTRLYVLLSEARRRRGDLAGARRAVEEGLARADDIAVRVEQGVVLAEHGDAIGAEQAWRSVLAREPLHTAAFAHLSAMFLRRGDTTGAGSLVDMALAAPRAHVEILRCALRLVHAAEPEGVARGTRVATLARALLRQTPDDAGAAIALGQALAQVGETKKAIGAFTLVESLARGTALAAEAQRARFTLAEPLAALEIDAAFRASAHASATALDAIAVRARRLAAEHPVWPAWIALGVIERRRGLLGSAREALVAALASCDGCAAAHRELARVYAGLRDAKSAMGHAEKGIALEGESAPALGAMACALAADARLPEAEAVLARALTVAPGDPELLAIRAEIRDRDAPPSAMGRLRALLGKRRNRA